MWIILNFWDFFFAIYAQARGLINICASLNSTCLRFSSLFCSLVDRLALKLLPAIRNKTHDYAQEKQQTSLRTRKRKNVLREEN